MFSTQKKVGYRFLGYVYMYIHVYTSISIVCLDLTADDVYLQCKPDGFHVDGSLLPSTRQASVRSLLRPDLRPMVISW